LYTTIFDKYTNRYFKLYKNSKLVRENNKLYELVNNKNKLEIVLNDKYIYKRNITRRYEERCYENLKGIRFS